MQGRKAFQCLIDLQEEYLPLPSPLRVNSENLLKLVDDKQRGVGLDQRRTDAPIPFLGALPDCSRRNPIIQQGSKCIRKRAVGQIVGVGGRQESELGAKAKNVADGRASTGRNAAPNRHNRQHLHCLVEIGIGPAPDPSLAGQPGQESGAQQRRLARAGLGKKEAQLVGYDQPTQNFDLLVPAKEESALLSFKTPGTDIWVCEIGATNRHRPTPPPGRQPPARQVSATHRIVR